MAARAADDRGFALLIVLWSAVLLAFIVTGITATGRTDTQLAANLRDAAVAEAAADGAVHAAVFHLLAADGWAADGRTRVLDVPGARVSVRVEDEGGKVNPNLASRELLRALLRQAGLAAEPADALAGNIVVWRFPQASGAEIAGLSARAGGSEAPSGLPYRAANRDYEPPGAPFESIGELGLVLGMTPGVLQALRPSLSLLNEAPPNPALAGPAVLRALSLSQPGTVDAARPAPRPEAVTVVAEAVTARGARFTRRAGIRLGRTEKERLASVATWEAGSGPANP